MKEFKIDKKAMYFTDETGYGVNVFWHDIVHGRGIRFFFSQFIRGIKCLLR